MLVHYWEVRVISIFESRVKTRVTRARQLQNALWRHTHTKDIQWTFESQSIHATPKRADDATSHQKNCRILFRNSGASSADFGGQSRCALSPSNRNSTKSRTRPQSFLNRGEQEESTQHGRPKRKTQHDDQEMYGIYRRDGSPELLVWMMHW